MSLITHITENLKIQVDSEAFVPTFKICLGYIARGYHKRKPEIHKDLAKLVNFDGLNISPKDFRMTLDAHREFIVNLRFFVLRNICKSLSGSEAESLYVKYGVDEQDAALTWQLLRQLKFRRDLRRSVLASFDFKLSITDVTPEALAVISKVIDQILNDMRRTIKGRVRKELRWISMSHNIPYSDLESDLIASVVFAYNQSLPNRYSYQHQVNYLGTSVSNRIRNIQAEFSSEKRRRMSNTGTKDAPKYEISILSENQLNHRNYSDTDIAYDSVMSEDSRTHLTNMEFDLSVDEILATTVGTKRGKLYSVLLGRDSQEFTDWLVNTRRIRGDRAGIDYISSKSNNDRIAILAEWLDVSRVAVRVGITRLGWSLGLHE